MKPVARSDRLIKQVVDQDTLVYDSTDDSACCLNSLASFVWRQCDGTHSVEDIAAALPADLGLSYGVDPEDVVWEVLEELDAHGLLATPVKDAQDGESADMRRRQMVKLLAALPLLPAIQSISAPISKSTASPAPTGSVTATLSVSQSVTQTATSSVTPTPGITQSVTASITPPVVSQTSTPAVSQTRTPAATPSTTATVTPTPTPSAT
jgi:hypothetical protein